jgi:hypothetical protein
LSKKSGKEKVVAVTVAVAKETKWVAACVRCYKQRRCCFVLCDIVFFPETFMKTGNFSEGDKGCIRKIIDYSDTSVSALTPYQCACCDFSVFEMYLREDC